MLDLKSAGLISPQFNNYPPFSHTRSSKDSFDFTTKRRDEAVLYLHVPYCPEKCNFCILSSVVRDPAAIVPELQAIKKEITMYSSCISDRTVVAALWGGGTPSSLSVKMIEDLYGHLVDNVNFSDTAEITVEVKPGTINRENLGAFRSCRANRLSFGVQSLNLVELNHCGRKNTFDVMAKEMETAAGAGFGNINFDIILGLPEQTPVTFTETCRQIFQELQPNHVSLYILIIHPQSYFDKLHQKQPHIFPSEKTKTEMYHIFFESAQKYGYVATSPLNVARSLDLCSKYQKYNWKGYERIAFGPEAIGFVGNTQYVNHGWNSGYKESIKSSDLPVNSSYRLNTEQTMRRDLVLGLQNLVVDKNEFKRLHGIDISEKFRYVWKYCKEHGAVEENDWSFFLTAAGRQAIYHIQTLFYEENVGRTQRGRAGILGTNDQEVELA